MTSNPSQATAHIILISKTKTNVMIRKDVGKKQLRSGEKDHFGCGKESVAGYTSVINIYSCTFKSNKFTVQHRPWQHKRGTSIKV